MGTVDKYIGDCMMAVFGAPIAHENDPERACRAALDMVEVVGAIPSDTTTSDEKPLALHISVNSGLVVAAPVGSAETSQYTVMGDAVNLASRLLSEAEDGEIVVGESTWQQVGGLFDFGPRSERSVKGKSEKVGFYQLLRTAEKPVARGRSLQLSLVGRHRELTLAESLLDEAATGRGSLLYITGEAGIGKSRLVEEIESSAKARGFLAVCADADAHGHRQGRSNSHHAPAGPRDLPPQHEPLRYHEKSCEGSRAVDTQTGVVFFSEEVFSNP